MCPCSRTIPPGVGCDLNVFKKTFSVLSVFLLLAELVSAEPAAPLVFSPEDRVMVIAPHPDDESLGLGGLLQTIKAAGASVKIIYLTNGESNEVSALFYEKRPLVLRSDFLKSGLVRKNEALSAMASIGISAKDLIFLGYPDGGTLNIWLKYWARSKPFRSFFTRINKVPYADAYSYGHPYKGEAIVRDFERLLLSETPTHVFVTAPFDLNRDHQAAFLFFQTALYDVAAQLPVLPKLHLYVVHAHGWPSPGKYLPDAPLGIPPNIDWNGEVRWHSYALNREETQKKQQLILQYKSQIAYKKNFLLSFARSNEIFFDYPHEQVERQPLTGGSLESFEIGTRQGDVRYRVLGNELWIGVPLSNSLDEMGALTTYVFSHRRDFLFSDMPKLAFKLFGNKLFTYDGFRPLHDPGLQYTLDKGILVIRVPLRLLKNPDYLFVSTRNAKEALSLDFGSWKALELAHDEAGKTLL